MLVFIGSYGNGLHSPDGEPVNLVAWAELDGLSEEEHERIAERVELNILDQCAYADIEYDPFEASQAGQSDTFVRVSTNAPEKLKAELREIMVSYLLEK